MGAQSPRAGRPARWARSLFRLLRNLPALARRSAPIPVTYGGNRVVGELVWYGTFDSSRSES